MLREARGPCRGGPCCTDWVLTGAGGGIDVDTEGLGLMDRAASALVAAAGGTAPATAVPLGIA